MLRIVRVELGACAVLGDEQWSSRGVGWKALAVRTFSIVSSVVEDDYDNNQKNNGTYFKSLIAKTLADGMGSTEDGHAKCTHNSYCQIIHLAETPSLTTVRGLHTRQ